MQRVVCLASGGLDSSTCLYVLRRQGISVLPVFVNYGQLNAHREYAALKQVVAHLGLDAPVEYNLQSFGSVIKSGITDKRLDIVADAFTPMRNMLFLVCAAALAKDYNAQAIAMGLLHVESAIFPDQTDRFITDAERAIQTSLGLGIRILLPLRDYAKRDVVKLAEQLGVVSFYSCHAGGEIPCGNCISCNEYKG